MNNEKNELKIILSIRNTKLKKENECEYCLKKLYIGEECVSMGIIDRKHKQKKRIYLCKECENMIDNNRENHNKEHQEYLFNERYIQET